MNSDQIKTATQAEILQWAETARRVEVCSAIAELLTKRQNIEAQLSQARVTLATTGQHADPQWYRSAVSASRITGNTIQRLQTMLTRRREERSIAYGGRWEAVAREMLDPNTFERMRAEVTRRQQQATEAA